MVTVYHNPRCSKSRQTLELLKSQGIDAELVLYLETPPNTAELAGLLKKLGISAHQLIRKSEQVYKDNFRNIEMTEQQWLEAMSKHPKLIERPIVVNGDRATLGRPPENVLEIL
jgi:arsenate reductase